MAESYNEWDLLPNREVAKLGKGVRNARLPREACFITQKK